MTEEIIITAGEYKEDTNQNNKITPILTAEELEKKYSWERTAKSRKIKYFQILEDRAKVKKKQLKIDKANGIVHTKKANTRISVPEKNLINEYIIELLIIGDPDKSI